jgi:hypothetical protein
LFRRDDPEAAPWTEEGKARIQKFDLWKISEKTADKEKEKNEEDGEENDGDGNAEEKPKKKRGRKRKNEEISGSEEEEEVKPKTAKKAKIDKTDSPTKNRSTLDNFFKRDGASPDKKRKSKLRRRKSPLMAPKRPQRNLPIRLARPLLATLIAMMRMTTCPATSENESEKIQTKCTGAKFSIGSY